MDEKLIGFMANVVLPSNDDNAVKYMQQTLDNRYNIYLVAVPIKVKDGTTINIVRLSAQVYIEFSDYEKIVDLVPLLIEEYYNKNSNENKHTVSQ